jgi:predicted MFS family arabinose efflux permease
MTLDARGSAEQHIPPRGLGVLSPFGFRDFRLLWFGLLISNIGTWMQTTALGYFVVKTAPTPQLASFYVGLLGAAGAVPVLVLSPIAGVAADRMPRRRTLLITNTLSSLIALALAMLAAFDRLNLWEVLLLTAARAATQSFDAPARQSWVPVLVPREFVGNAIGLNSIAFNAPAVIGPPIAGLLILAIGLSAAFYVNAIATLAVVVALLFMQPAPASSKSHEPALQAISEGLAFLFSHPVLRSVISLLVILCLLIRPYQQLLPAYAAHIVHVDARGLGILLAASGLGAIGGSIVTAVVGAHRRGVIWFVSAAVMSVATMLLGATHLYALALPILALLGIAVLSFVGSSNVLLQTLSPDDLRGRIISVFSMIALGVVPAGSLLLGSVASFIGLPDTLIGGGALSLLFTVIIFARNAALRDV